mmetsp:Transcript_24831/g.81227  ORF Transcript_24831/g.81227 Transcript_24831/m.81227 type:complete len:299 (+) Transcript_24831:255-1151(+)
MRCSPELGSNFSTNPSKRSSTLAQYTLTRQPTAATPQIARSLFGLRHPLLLPPPSTVLRVPPWLPLSLLPSIPLVGASLTGLSWFARSCCSGSISACAGSRCACVSSAIRACAYSCRACVCSAGLGRFRFCVSCVVALAGVFEGNIIASLTLGAIHVPTGASNRSWSAPFSLSFHGPDRKPTMGRVAGMRSAPHWSMTSSSWAFAGRTSIRFATVCTVSSSEMCTCPAPITSFEAPRVRVIASTVMCRLGPGAPAAGAAGAAAAGAGSALVVGDDADSALAVEAAQPMSLQVQTLERE